QACTAAQAALEGFRHAFQNEVGLCLHVEEGRSVMKYSVPAGIAPGKELEAFIKALEAILAMCDFASKNPSIPAEAGAEAAVEAYVRPVTDDLQSLAELKAFREGMEAARRLLFDDPPRAAGSCRRTPRVHRRS